MHISQNCCNFALDFIDIVCSGRKTGDTTYYFKDKSPNFKQYEVYVPFVHVHGWEGQYCGFGDFVFCPSHSMLFKLKIMSTIYNFGGTVNYNDNSKNYHIDANNRDLSSIIKEFDTKEETLSVSSEYDSDTSLFCRITKAAYDKGVAQQVEEKLCSACVSAPKLVKALNTNDALGYTDTQNLYSTDLYDMLNDHYGLPFKKHQFTVCRSKNSH